ncbi:MAG: hypothetical protein ACFFFK_09685 [Candidatus Thorarchaeota archaeon]
MTRIAFLQFNSCGGCLLSLLANPVLLDVLKSEDICYFPMISERNTLEEADFVVIEGCAIHESDTKLILQLYTAGAKIVSLGTCATLGGIMSQSSKMQSYPVENYVDTYAQLPGCPPPQKLIGALLLSMIQGTEFSLPEKNVCSECPYTQDQDYSTEIAHTDPVSIPKSCFLREGVLCLGLITRAGCGAKCVQVGAPCDGCFGSSGRSLPAAIANLFSILKITPEIRNKVALATRYQKPRL